MDGARLSAGCGTAALTDGARECIERAEAGAPVAVGTRECTGGGEGGTAFEGVCDMCDVLRDIDGRSAVADDIARDTVGTRSAAVACEGVREGAWAAEGAREWTECTDGGGGTNSSAAGTGSGSGVGSGSGIMLFARVEPLTVLAVERATDGGTSCMAGGGGTSSISAALNPRLNVGPGGMGGLCVCRDEYDGVRELLVGACAEEFVCECEIERDTLEAVR